MPRFESHPPAPVATEIVPGVPAAAFSKLAEPHKRPAFPLLLIVSILVLLSAVFVLYFALRQRPPRNVVSVLEQGQLKDPFWPRLFGNGQSTSVVVSDTCLVMLRDILHSDVSVDEYSRHEYTSDLLKRVSAPGLRSALELIASRQYTSLADTNVASKIEQISQQFGNSRTSIRYARYLNIRDFKTENFIFIGSCLGIPWVQLFEPQLNFALEEDKLTHRFHFRNRKPQRRVCDIRSHGGSR